MTFPVRPPPLSRRRVAYTLGAVGDAFLNLTVVDIAARVQSVAVAAAGGPVVVHVGDEVHGYRNVGVDLPRGRRSAAEGRLLRNRIRAALEVAGVIMVETAVAPKVGGNLRGHVRVQEVAPSWGDASGFARAPRGT